MTPRCGCRSRFSSLSWGLASTCVGSPQAGIIAGGMADGVVNFWDPQALLSGTGDGFLAKVDAAEGSVRAIDFNPTPATGHLVAAGARCVASRCSSCRCLRCCVALSCVLKG
jgi:hypothetical protein